MAQQDKISILGPRDDGTNVIEFRTAAGERLAISVPSTKGTAVLKHFQAATAEPQPTGLRRKNQLLSHPLALGIAEIQALSLVVVVDLGERPLPCPAKNECTGNEVKV